MDVEFHYYMTYIIALRAGFKTDDAYTIAYSSQYTDDNDTPYEILGDDVPYKNYVSQTTDITKPKEELLRIHPYFHFFPGSKREIVNNLEGHIQHFLILYSLSSCPISLNLTFPLNTVAM
jgi:hypothetical protein